MLGEKLREGHKDTAVRGNGPKPIEFWFDFASPYAYLAAQSVEKAAARVGRRVRWRPFLLGVVFKTTGMAPLAGMPLRGEYARRDIARLARRLGVPCHEPKAQSTLSLPTSRTFYWLEHVAPPLAPAFARAALDAIFAAGADLSRPEEIAAVVTGVGGDPAAVPSALADPGVKDALRAVTGEALAHGVFGSPFMIVDGEPFWGGDRLPLLEEWVRRGGW